MNKFLVYSELPNGNMNRWCVYAVSAEEAEADVKKMVQDAISVKAFDWDIQFKFL